MKYTCIPILLLFSCNKSQDKLLDQYPFFTNEIYDTVQNTITLNNFEAKYKNGMEYVFNSSGQLLETRNYKANYLNGNVFNYASNGKIKILAHFINDTLEGNYFKLDTISGKPLEYREYLNDFGSFVNQQAFFKGNKIDLKHSSFIHITKENEYEYKIERYGYVGFPYLKMYVKESNDDTYNFDIDSLKPEIISIDNKTIAYKIKDKNNKYISGYLLNYRYPYKDEIKEMGYKEDQEIGIITYFKIRI